MTQPSAFENITKEMVALHLKKQDDYGLQTVPFYNVQQSADFGIPPWLAAVLRANDKMTRLKRYACRGTLSNESVEDSLLDAANYFVIALVLWREQARLPTNYNYAAASVESPPREAVTPVCTCKGPADQSHESGCPYYSPLQEKIRRLESELRESKRWKEVLTRETQSLKTELDRAREALSQKERNIPEETAEYHRNVMGRCLAVLSLAIPTPEQGYVIDGGLNGMLRDMERVCREVLKLRSELQEANHKASVLENYLKPAEKPSPRIAAWLENQQRNRPDLLNDVDFDHHEQVSGDPTRRQMCYIDGWNAAFEHLIRLCLLNEIHS